MNFIEALEIGIECYKRNNNGEDPRRLVVNLSNMNAIRELPEATRNGRILGVTIFWSSDYNDTTGMLK